VVAASVSLRPVAQIMRHAINLDHQPRRSAVEIDDKLPDRMLIAEFKTAGPLPQSLPQQALRQGQIPA
jgi:hypothetical protein